MSSLGRISDWEESRGLRYNKEDVYFDWIVRKVSREGGTFS
jgi:hypothetical protein